MFGRVRCKAGCGSGNAGRQRKAAISIQLHHNPQRRLLLGKHITASHVDPYARGGRARSEEPAQPACSQRVQRVTGRHDGPHCPHAGGALRVAVVYTRQIILVMHLIIIVLVRANHGPRHIDRTNTCRIVLDDFHRGWARLVADDALSHHVDVPS